MSVCALNRRPRCLASSVLNKQADCGRWASHCYDLGLTVSNGVHIFFRLQRSGSGNGMQPLSQRTRLPDHQDPSLTGIEVCILSYTPQRKTVPSLGLKFVSFHIRLLWSSSITGIEVGILSYIHHGIEVGILSYIPNDSV